MSDCFSPRKFIHRTGNDLLGAFLGSHGISLDLSMFAKARQRDNAVFDSYQRLDDCSRLRLEANMTEIHKVTGSLEAGATLHKRLVEVGIELPEDLSEASVHDQAVWAFLYARKAWDGLAKYAFADRLPDSVWTKMMLPPLEKQKIADSDNPDLVSLTQVLSAYLNNLDGRGKYAKPDFHLRNGMDEYYFIYMNDYNNVKTECRQGQFDHSAINFDAIEMVFVFHRQTRQLEAKFPKGLDKRHKEDLCELWARTVKGCTLDGREKNVPVHCIERILQEPCAFTPDEDGKIVSAHLHTLCISIRGRQGSRRIFEEETGDIYECMTRELNQNVLPLTLCQVEYIRIRIRLADEFGTSRRQTIKVTPDGSDVLNKNPKVQDVLEAALVRWNIAAA